MLSWHSAHFLPISCRVLNINKQGDVCMNPRILVASTVLGFAVVIAGTIYYQQFFFQMSEKLALWTIISEVVGLGGLILAEAFVFLWNIQVQAFG
jgi:hypothetical protein